MTKKGRVAKLFIGSIRLGRDPHEERAGQYHGEIYFRTGLNTLSSGLIKLNKKRNKLKSYDYILCQSAYAGAALALKAQKEINIPIILRTHGVDIQKDPENQYGWRLDSERVLEDRRG